MHLICTALPNTLKQTMNGKWFKKLIVKGTVFLDQSCPQIALPITELLYLLTTCICCFYASLSGVWVAFICFSGGMCGFCLHLSITIISSLLSAIGLARGVRHCLMCVSLTMKASHTVVNLHPAYSTLAP